MDLRPGDIIGRSPRAALRVNDPRVSEAHALVSLRGLSLRLLALRGRFALAGTPSVDTALHEGLVVQLASDLLLTVEEIALGGVVLALESATRERLFLPPVASIDGASGEVMPGFRHGAGAVVWSDDDALHVRVAGRPDAILGAGEAFAVGAHRYTVVAASLAEIALAATAGDAAFNAPLVLHVRYDTVHVWRGPDAFAIDGVPARILSELALMGVPAAWRAVAGLVWPQELDDVALRQKWDSGLQRLRKRLRELGLRRDLLRTDGAGLVELFLRPGDRVEDAS
ncbi:MAG: hypothetical protein KC635_15570 [Myxococcales bacterium]|nr:hypothetical protein [Myxococcales bacterium]